MSRWINRPSPAMGVACLALIVALGGTGVAAVSQLAPRNSVGPAQIRPNAVTRPKIRTNAVNSARVANRSLLAVDFAVGQLPAGAIGPKGDKGDKGDTGAPGLSAVQLVTSSKSVVNAASNLHTVNCPAGKRVLGGGSNTSSISASAGPFVYTSIPNGNSGWLVAMAASPVQSWTLTVYAICATVS